MLAIEQERGSWYDAGVDLYRLALGALGEHDPGAGSGLDDSQWWRPIDLGGDLPASARGFPRLAPPTRAAAILDRLAHLSQPLRTRLRIDGDTGVIDLR